MADEMPAAPAPPLPVPDPVPIAEPPPRKIAGVPIDVFVKGGTTTFAWDEEQRYLAEQSDQLRSHQDEQRRVVDQVHSEGGGIADLISLPLAHGGNPKVVIEYCYRDSALNRECLSELVFVPHPDGPDKRDLVLTLVCPYCLERTGRPDQSQNMIRQSHRKFYLRPVTDPSYPEDKKHWVSHVDGSFHHLAGLITTHDAITCMGLGCKWRFRIDDSKLKEV